MQAETVLIIRYKGKCSNFKSKVKLFGFFLYSMLMYAKNIIYHFEAKADLMVN